MKRNLLFVAMFLCFAVWLAGEVGWLKASVRIGAASIGAVLLVIALATDDDAPSQPS
jgi:hypothetical protein